MTQTKPKRPRRLGTVSPEDIALIKAKRQWVRVNIACSVTGFSRSTILRIVGEPENKIRTYLHKSRRDAQSGSRMIWLQDLLDYFDRSAAAAKVAEAAAKALEARRLARKIQQPEEEPVTV